MKTETLFFIYRPIISIFLLYSMVSFGGCSKIDEFLLENEAAEHLLDPSGAQFRNAYVVIEGGSNNKILCGEINGKNAYGAYVGYKRFFYIYKSLYMEKDPLEDKWVWYFNEKDSTSLEMLEEHGLAKYDLKDWKLKYIEYRDYLFWKKSYPRYCELKPSQVSTIISNDNKEGAEYTETELKEKTTLELDIRNDLAYLPNENKPFTGKHETYYPSGKKSTEQYFVDGKANGLRISWYESGQKLTEANYKYGKIDGLSVIWSEHGQIISEDSYSNGKLHGLSKSFGNGRMITETNYKDGKKDGLDTMYYPVSGFKMSETSYKDGRQIGETSFWLLDGSKTIRRTK